LRTGKFEVAFVRLAQLAPAVAGSLHQTHQDESAKPVLHRRLPPLRSEPTCIREHAVEMVHRRHVMGVILVKGFRAANPPYRQLMCRHGSTKVGIFAAISDEPLVEAPGPHEVLFRHCEVERPETAIVAAKSMRAFGRSGAFGVFYPDLLEPGLVDPGHGGSIGQVGDLAHQQPA